MGVTPHRSEMAPHVMLAAFRTNVAYRACRTSSRMAAAFLGPKVGIVIGCRLNSYTGYRFHKRSHLCPGWISKSFPLQYRTGIRAAETLDLDCG